MSSNSEDSREDLGLTSDDRARIQQYLRTPTYERDVDDLRPSDDESSEL